MAALSQVRMSCLCGRTEQSLSLKSSGFPVEAFLCHCDMCRWTSGLLCTSYLVLLDPPQSLVNLTRYQASENVSRYHCSTCGTQVFEHKKISDTFFVAAGVLRSEGNVINVEYHQWVGDTIDGGLSSFLPKFRGHALPFFTEDPESEQRTRDDDRQAKSTLAPREARLPGECHCGGVQYYITQPNTSSRELSSPYPDLLVPYHSFSSANPDDVKWWLRDNDTKFLAGLCTCVSCRLASGFPVQSWAFVPKHNIFNTDGSTLDFKHGTLQQYKSSPGIYREFCSRCGATVFWHCEGRPDLIDISVGLLRAETGAKAEQWLQWAKSRVSFVEEALDQDLATSLEVGLKQWDAEKQNRDIHLGSTGTVS